MKTLIHISGLLFLLNNLSFAQFYTNSVISDYVIEFMEIADGTSKSMDSLGIVQKEFSEWEINHVAELYYKANDQDPTGFNKYISIEFEKWGKIVKENKGKVHEPKPAMKKLLLVKKIAERYGITITEVIGTPAFLRGRYLELRFTNYHSVSMNIDTRAHTFIFSIEDVLKGDKYFNVGDTISILMLPNVESPSPDFIPGNSYLIPIGTLLGYQEGTFNMVFSYLNDTYDAWVMGKPPKTFPIENEIIKNVDYFGIQDTSWTDFKKYFKDTYLIFK